MRLEAVKRCVTEGNSIMAVKARYPYVSRETWWTRYWHLRRKLHGYDRVPSPVDCRTAAILLQFAQRMDLPSSPRQSEASEYLSGMVTYGQDRRKAQLNAASETRLGA